MKKVSIFLAGFLICSNLLASEKEDINFLEELFKQQKYNIAINESENFISKYPKSKYVKNVRIRLAKTYYFEQNYNKAITYFNVVLTEKLSDSERDDIKVYLIRSYAGVKNYGKAYEILETIDKKSPYYEKALLDLGTHYLETGKYVDAQRELTKVLGLRGEYYNDAVLNLALSTYNNSQYVKTVVYLDEYYNGNKKDKNFSLMNYLYGSSYYKMNDSEKAIPYFKKVIELYPESSYGKKSLLTMIELYLNQSNVRNAEVSLSQLKGTKEEGEGIKIFADYYTVRGNYQNSIKYYERIISSNKPDIVYGYAFSLYKLGREQEAISKFKSLKGTKYYNQSIYYIFAGEYKLKNYRWVIENKELQKSLTLNKSDSEGLQTIIANSAYELKNYGLARQYYESVYLSNPNKENLYKLIVLESKSGTISAMNSKFNDYNNKFPTDQEYKKNIYLVVGERYYKDGNLEEARGLYKNYLSQDRDVNIISNLIAVLLEEKNYDGVMELLNIQDSSDENTYLKGIASMGMGKYDEADIYFKNILTSETVSKDIKEKASYNEVKNYFLWEKYDDVILKGQEYLVGENLYNLDEIVDRIALSYFRLDQMDKSREYLEKLKLVPEYSDYAQFQIAETYYNQKDFTKASEEYRKSFETATKDEYKEKALYWEANSLHNLGKVDEFKIKTAKLLELYPNSSFKDNILILNGEILSNVGDSKKVLKNYEELYTTSKNHLLKEEAVTKIVEIYNTEKNYVEGLKWIEKLNGEEKKSYYRAKFYDQKQEYDKANIEYQKLLSSKDYKDYAAINLGNYWYRNNNLDKAKENYIIVNNLESSQYKDIATFQLASIDEKNGNHQEAIRSFTKVYILYPNGNYALEAQIKVAENYEKIGQFNEAISQYNELNGKEEEKGKYKKFLLEKLIFLNLKTENKVKAEEYYNNLVKLDVTASEKYKDFFKGGN
ncbi:tetratricopeptide repeat protein [Cetobacterium sp. 2A]|uniref:tetratricopeptide repeat protein n=1 Tax=Cetobacterium sp. 2A TaxID=2754723 RepID=UPI00163BD68E|nr:tetratricopeptide repeat protein [Cetobacterium sp. 2A]MBC2856629.1 tetratricopeptide repeat protein [Cetobacterium sp. 2A]